MAGKTTITTPNGNLAVSPRCIHTGGVPPMASTDGTNATPVATETYFSEILVSQPTLVTGISIFNGTTVGTNKHFAAIANKDGTVLATTAAAGVLTAGADAYQRIPLTADLTLAPGTYYVALQMDGNTDRYNAHPIGNFGAGKATGTVFGTLASFTPPTTFTADLGPIASLY